MATSYFEKFPRLLYSHDEGKSGQVVPDIMRRVDILRELKNNNAFYDLYDVQDGETPEIVADKFYGDPTLHWIILMVNDIVDPRFEWVLTYDQLRRYTEKKYGGPLAPYEIHHPEGYNSNRDENYEQDSNFFLLEGVGDNRARLIFSRTDPTIRTPITLTRNPLITNLVTNFDYEDRLNEQRRRIKVIKPELVAEILSNFDDEITR